MDYRPSCSLVAKQYLLRLVWSHGQHICVLASRYYNGGVLLDEVAVDAVQPPPRPSTVPQALQQTMPLADVLNLIAKPPGSAPPFIPYKPVRVCKSLCMYMCECIMHHIPYMYIPKKN